MQRPGQYTSKATATSVKITEIHVFIQYKPGKSMISADHLNRNIHSGSSREPTVPNLDLEVSALELNASPSK